MSLSSTTPTRTPEHARSPELDRLADLVSDIDIASLATVRENGRIHGRPMATQAMHADGSLWFATSRASLVVAEIGRDPRVHLSYADQRRFRWVSLTGRARVVDDPARSQECWSMEMEAWFDGPDDPDLVLLRVDVEEAEFWEAKHGKVVSLLQIAKNAVTGHPSEEGTMEHGTFDP